MSLVKPLIALGSIGLGAAIAATVVYMQSNSRAFTSALPPPVQPQVAAAIGPVAPTPAPETNVLTMPPVEILGTLERPVPAVPTPRNVVLEPCSSWQELASGPATRRVRVLCEQSSSGPVPGS